MPSRPTPRARGAFEQRGDDAAVEPLVPPVEIGSDARAQHGARGAVELEVRDPERLRGAQREQGELARELSRAQHALAARLLPRARVRPARTAERASAGD